MRTKLRFLTIIVVATASTSSRSRAENAATKPDQIVGGVIAIGGSADERARAAVGSAVVEAARTNGWWLPPKPLTKKESDGLVNCTLPAEPWKCIPSTIETQGIHQALVVTVEAKQSDSGAPMTVLTGQLIVNSPRALVVHQRFCEHCAEDKLARAATELTEQLIKELEVRTGRTILDIESTPAGARIVLDGQPIGATNGIFNTFPGTHIVVLEKAGYVSETIQIEANEGKTGTIAPILRTTSEPCSTALPDCKCPADRPDCKITMIPPSKPSRVVPVIFLGGGALLLAGSVTEIYYGQQDGADEKYRHPHATAIGVVTGLVGLGAIGTGVYLWWRGSKSSAPTASPTKGGAVVGWTGAF